MYVLCCYLCTITIISCSFVLLCFDTAVMVAFRCLFLTVFFIGLPSAL